MFFIFVFGISDDDYFSDEDRDEDTRDEEMPEVSLPYDSYTNISQLSFTLPSLLPSLIIIRNHWAWVYPPAPTP